MPPSSSTRRSSPRQGAAISEANCLSLARSRDSSNHVVKLSLIGHILCEVEGRVYAGTYEVTKGVLKVTLPGHGSKYASLASWPDVIAEIILRELVEETKRKGT